LIEKGNGIFKRDDSEVMNESVMAENLWKEQFLETNSHQALSMHVFKARRKKSVESILLELTRLSPFHYVPELFFFIKN